MLTIYLSSFQPNCYLFCKAIACFPILLLYILKGSSFMVVLHGLTNNDYLSIIWGDPVYIKLHSGFKLFKVTMC